MTQLASFSEPSALIGSTQTLPLAKFAISTFLPVLSTIRWQGSVPWLAFMLRKVRAPVSWSMRKALTAPLAFPSNSLNSLTQ